MNPQPIPPHEHWIIVGFFTFGILSPIIGGMALNAYRVMKEERRKHSRMNHPTARQHTR